MPAKEETKPKEIFLNNALPTLHIDYVNARHRKDGFNYLSFSTHLPDNTVEQVRLMIDDEHLHKIIDNLCRTVNYFPENPLKK